MKKALLIIDVQNDYFPGGKNELVHAARALAATVKVLEEFRRESLPVFFIQHISGAGASFFAPGTEGAEIHRDIAPGAGEKVIVKHRPNSFSGTELEAELRLLGVDELVVCGMMTHMCVDSTVRAASDLGFSTTLISDACATKALDLNGVSVPAETVQNVYIASLAGSFATVKKSDEYLGR